MSHMDDDRDTTMTNVELSMAFSHNQCHNRITYYIRWINKGTKCNEYGRSSMKLIRSVNLPCDSSDLRISCDQWPSIVIIISQHLISWNILHKQRIDESLFEKWTEHFDKLIFGFDLIVYHITFRHVRCNVIIKYGHEAFRSTRQIGDKHKPKKILWNFTIAIFGARYFTESEVRTNGQQNWHCKHRRACRRVERNEIHFRN